MNFRNDINGLRAIALIAVVLFHFYENSLPGGFAGVDVFLVISGYLMTSILVSRAERNNSSLIEFYVARANRIVPALSVMCLLLLCWGWFNLAPIEYKVLGKHSIVSAVFLSNIYYFKESGYFDVDATEKWLLHTWSLSVEWQFYILYPIVIFGVLRFIGLVFLRRFIVLAAFCSFLFSISVSESSPDWAFFMLPSRAWEMLVGALAYLYPLTIRRRDLKRIIEVVGITLIISSYWYIESSMTWPAPFALFAVLGTYLILLVNIQDSVLTNNILFNSLGKWSYSIYLWHWPVVVYINYYGFESWRLAGIPISILIGYVSFKYVESIRFSKYCNIKELVYSWPLYIMSSACCIGLIIYISNGAINRYDISNVNAWKRISTEIVMPSRSNEYCFYSFYKNKQLLVNDKSQFDCYLGVDSESSDTLLFGDSFAGHNDPFWDLFFKDINQSFQSVTTNWCFPSFSANFIGPSSDRSYEQCLINRTYLKDAIDNTNVRNLILAGSWKKVMNEGYLDEVVTVIAAASDAGINVIVMPTPRLYSTRAAAKFQKNILENGMTTEVYDFPPDVSMDENALIKGMVDQFENVFFIERRSIYDDLGGFLENGNFIPYTQLDGRHISVVGSKASYSYFSSTEAYDKIKLVFSGPLSD